MGKYFQGFKGMRQDVNETNMSPDYYYYAKNLTTSTTGDTANIGGISNIKSDLDLVEINLNSFDGRTLDQVNGGIEIDSERTILITTYEDRSFLYNYILLVNYSTKEVTSIYRPYNSDYDVDIEADLLIREKVTIIHNKENELVNKIYWIDGEHQVRSLNVAPIVNGEKEYLSDPIDLLDAVAKVDFSDIEINEPSSYPLYNGISTAGMVQYAYAYFNQNGQSTGVSPLSEIIPLTKSDGQGGDVNQIVGQSNHIVIDNIDPNYDYVQLYRIKYNTSSEEPVISLIQERVLDDDSASISFIDNGTSISDVSTENFLFLGSDIYIPKAFEVKDDRMFIANFEEDNWDITLEQFDSRAYRLRSDGGYGTTELTNSGGTGIITFYGNESIPEVPTSHDCISDLTQYKYKSYTPGAQVLGAQGQNISLTITESDLDIDDSTPYYRGMEVYRFAVMYVNSYGKKSTPQWVCDYMMPNLGKKYSVELELSISQQDRDELDIQGYIGCRVERTDSDKYVVSSGQVNTCMHKFRCDASEDIDPLFDDTSSTDSHSVGYINREEAAKSNTIYPNYLYNTGNENFEVGEFVKSSSINNNSILTQSLLDSLLAGTAADRGSFVRDDSVDSKIKYGVSHGAGNATEKTITFQNTKVWNINSPEVTFESLSDANVINNIRINSVFASESFNVYNYKVFAEVYNASTNLLEASEESSYNTWFDLSNTFTNVMSYGTSTLDGDGVYYKFNHNYSKGDSSITKYVNSDLVNTTYPVYGKPLLMEEGASATAYNNDGNLIISNNLYDFDDDLWNKKSESSAIGCNSKFNRNIYVVPLKTGATTDEGSSRNHLRLEHAIDSVIPNTTHKPMFTVVDMLSGATEDTLYGGNTYEARTRNSYISLGEYSKLDVTSINDLTGTGDTYYRNWSFARSSEGDADTSLGRTPAIIENISVPIETYVDLNKRNDLTSGTDGDVSNIKFKTFDELHKYNTVYNRVSNAVTHTPLSYLENSISLFPNLIRASAQKVPGEIVDSFADILVNEETNLNSSYGAINKLKLFHDNMYVFQENAIAFQSINPRAQVVADDGLSVELGTGTLFGDNKYMTTDSGILYNDRFSVANGNSSLYYFDRMNYSIASLNGSSIAGLSDAKFISRLVKRITDKTSSNMAYVGFDFINNNLFVTLPTDDEENTIVFNELSGEFDSTRTIDLDLYIQSRNGIMGVNSEIGMIGDARLYLIERGDSYSNSLGSDTTSEMTILVKPKEGLSARYDSIE